MAAEDQMSKVSLHAEVIAAALILAPFLMAGDNGKATKGLRIGQKSSVTAIASSHVFSEGNSSKAGAKSVPSTCNLRPRAVSKGAIGGLAFQIGCFGCYMRLHIADECPEDPTWDIYLCWADGSLRRRGCDPQEDLPQHCIAVGCPGERDTTCSNPSCG